MDDDLDAKIRLLNELYKRAGEREARRQQAYGHAPRGIMLAHYHTHTGDQAAEQGDWNVALYHWNLAREAMNG